MQCICSARAKRPAAAWFGVFLLASSIVCACGHGQGPTAPSSGTAGPAAPQGSIQFVSSTPAANSVIVIGTSANGAAATSFPPGALSMTFSVQTTTTIAGAELEVDLLEESGGTCAYSYSAAHDVAAGTPTAFTNTAFAWRCGLSGRTTAARVTLLASNRTSQSQTSYSNYLVQSIPITFTYQPYASPPAGTPSAPSIATLGWHDMVPGCGGDCFLPGDPIFVYCGTAEADGAGVTTTLTLTWDDNTSQTTTTTFPAGASSSPTHGLSYGLWSVQVTGAASLLTSVVRGANDVPQHATAVCSTVNVRGETATKSIRLPY